MPASKVNDGKVLARVEELEVVCPGNALVWEFLQLKWLDRVELKDRINVMINRMWDCACSPDYIERVHRDGYNVTYRKKIIELYLEVLPTLRILPSIRLTTRLLFSSTSLVRPLESRSTCSTGSWRSVAAR